MDGPILRRPLGHSLREAGKALRWVALGLGLIALMMAPFCSVHTGGERHARARLDLMQLEKAVRRYVQQAGQPPARLRALVDRGLLEGLPKDPWGNEYGYAFQDGEVRLWSLGEDGLPCGEEADADIGQRFPLEPPRR